MKGAAADNWKLLKIKVKDATTGFKFMDVYVKLGSEKFLGCTLEIDAHSCYFSTFTAYQNFHPKSV